jgi:hypothetical protein
MPIKPRRTLSLADLRKYHYLNIFSHGMEAKAAVEPVITDIFFKELPPV